MPRARVELVSAVAAARTRLAAALVVVQPARATLPHALPSEASARGRHGADASSDAALNATVGLTLLLLLLLL